ncbi:hypothetical protein L1987_02352 [Smallanthus sonchifolius]|uniref:Uncharacterized protein n=1 Tax=Smallanthus sonchifolius TaxID=185202 RepID=A0ACB9K7J9_9ASTR|nr:hypothetical protein L1987_02352 [Smallanthus sonchifolius]
MDFGKLLLFRVDGIPSKLGHYVVDKFNQEKMRIRVPGGKIKINSEVIHKLLGIPCGGVGFESVTPDENLHEGVISWRQYPGRFVAPAQLVDSIENSEDGDSFNFRMDFIMLFLTIMVECQKQGSYKESILSFLSPETKFTDMDWCGYIVESMKSCKNGWKRKDITSPFTGPLTILMLLYADIFICGGMKVDTTVNAITYWNMKRLKLREKLEIKGGGFGKGEFKGLTEVEVDQTLEGDLLMDEMTDVARMLSVIKKEKNKIENTLGLMYEKHHEKEEVLNLIARTVKKKRDLEEPTEILKNLQVKSEQDLEANLVDEATDGENISEEVLGKLEKGRTDKKENQGVKDVEGGLRAKKGCVSNVEFEPPSFSIGLTQMESASMVLETPITDGKDVDEQFVAIGNEEMTNIGRNLDEECATIRTETTEKTNNDIDVEDGGAEIGKEVVKTTGTEVEKTGTIWGKLLLNWNQKGKTH